MVITILEAHVAPDQWSVLRGALQEAIKTPEPGLLQTFLVQSSRDDTLWRIITLWQSREALAAMRSSGVPRGVLIFRAAGAEPALEVFDVTDHLFMEAI
jgi:hypothetical protein